MISPGKVARCFQNTLFKPSGTPFGTGIIELPENTAVLVLECLARSELALVLTPRGIVGLVLTEDISLTSDPDQE